MGIIENFDLKFEYSMGQMAHPDVLGAKLRHARHLWTNAEVAGALAQLTPPPSDRPGNQSLPRQQLSAAYLAGVAAAQEEMLLQKRGSLVEASIREARALLKNRAASQESRASHAFAAGVRAARGVATVDAPRTTGIATPDTAQALKLFIRQPFTESGAAEQAVTAAVLDQIDEHNSTTRPFQYLTGRKAESAATFKEAFKAETGRAFTPKAFRSHRLDLLSQADAFVNIRVGMSESSAFELSYHVFRGACTPVLFLVWKQAPIKTTLLKELDNLCDITYLEFEHAEDLRSGMGEFFRRCRPSVNVAAHAA